MAQQLLSCLLHMLHAQGPQCRSSLCRKQAHRLSKATAASSLILRRYHMIVGKKRQSLCDPLCIAAVLSNHCGKLTCSIGILLQYLSIAVLVGRRCAWLLAQLPSTVERIDKLTTLLHRLPFALGGRRMAVDWETCTTAMAVRE
jgi:hypothetical protein